MSFGENWAYSDSINWNKDYPTARGKNQSPVNIDKDKVQRCDTLCEISLKYARSNCILTVKNRTPIVHFSSGSYVKLVAKNEIYALDSMTIHTPSLHSLNGVKYDMEVVLYHKMGGSTDPKSNNFVPGGVAISLLFQRGSSHGRQNNFFNSFVYEIPNDVDSLDKNLDIDVGNEWGPELILPDIKSYFYYPGSLPMPPCEEGWTWVVFEEIQNISSHILDVLNLAFKNNIRPLKALGSRAISYHDEIELKMDNELIKKSKDTTPEKYESKPTEYKDTKAYKLRLNLDETETNKKYFKIAITALLVLLTIYASLRMTKYIVENELLTIVLATTSNFIKNAVIGTSKKN